MRDIINKLRAPALGLMMALAATMTLTMTTTSADAHHWHHHHGCCGGWVGPAFIGGLAIGALASRPYYRSYAYGNCWRERRVFWRHGHRHVRLVTVCA